MKLNLQRIASFVCTLRALAASVSFGGQWMHLVLLVLGGALTLPAGVVSGVALEWASGKPLSRTIVHLQPVPGSGRQLQPLQTRSGRSGQFQFVSVPDGLYLLETQREGFLPAAYGQRRPTSYGTPIMVSKDSALFAELRLHRMGSLTGTVQDENNVGMPRVNVVAYRAQLPLRIAGRGIADDRGIYRISGLSLGKYWVRTVPYTLDDGTGLLPVFGPEAREPRDAQAHEVRFDNDTTDANVRPEPGSLSTLSGVVACDRGPGTPVVVTLSSEFSRQTTQGTCAGAYTFGGLAPAMYEVFANYVDGAGSGFAERFIGQNTQMPMQIVSTDTVNFSVRNAMTRAPLRIPVSLLGRRDDLSGAEPEREVPLQMARLSAGYWEFMATVGAGYYVSSIRSESNEINRSRRPARPFEWFGVYLEPFRSGDRININVSDRAAQLSGVVRQEGKPVPGIPVFLWPIKDEIRRMLGGPRQMLADFEGRFHFTGLPPGDYRLLATMDIREMNGDVAEESRAKFIQLSESQTAEAELAVWLAP